jgi:2'-5' RNA ligase
MRYRQQSTSRVPPPPSGLSQVGQEMITYYESDVSHWEDWQKRYRFGVLLIIPPGPPLAQVDALRARYDPQSQSYCGAHISLTVPFPRALDEADWDELESIVSDIEPFPIRYGPLMNYLPHPGVCLAIEPQDELDRLRAALETASVFEGALLRRYPFSAHVTIAEFISVERTERLMDELEDVTPQGVFECAAVSYAVPDADFHFTERKRLELAHCWNV